MSMERIDMFCVLCKSLCINMKIALHYKRNGNEIREEI